MNVKAILKARLDAMKSTLGRASQSQKENQVSMPTANEFNAIRQSIVTALPAAEAHLPRAIPKHAFADGLSEANYLDLEIAIDQTIAVMNVLEF